MKSEIYRIYALARRSVMDWSSLKRPGFSVQILQTYFVRVGS